MALIQAPWRKGWPGLHLKGRILLAPYSGRR